MFRHLLLPVDLTAKNQKALDAALELAAKVGATVTLFHVIETIEHLPFEELEDFYKRLEEKASVQLKKLAGTFTAKGVKLHREIVYGKRVEEILRKAEAGNVDLIVMSSHKVEEAQQGPKGWGTLSHQVGVLAPCSVLLVK